MQDLTGTVLGRYRLVRLVGRGGMAAVYEAHDPTLDRMVAVKVLASHLVDEEGFLGRFQHEARAVAALRHPSIVHVYDFGSQGGTPYMVMEFVDGPSLQALLADVGGRDERLPADAVVRLMTATCSALDYAHQRGMVHRDIKPANVLLTADLEPVLSDFGIARIAGATNYTATGMVMGTAHYMAPEQAQGLPIDGRCDEYSAAVVAFEALAGRVPFRGDTTGSVLAQHIAAPVPSLRTLCPGLPGEVDAVFARGLAKTAGERYPSAAEFAATLRDALGVEAAAASGPLLPPSAALDLLGPGLTAQLRTRPASSETAAKEDEKPSGSAADEGTVLERPESVAERPTTVEAPDDSTTWEVPDTKSAGGLEQPAAADEHDRAAGAKSKPAGGHRTRTVLAALAALVVVAGAATALALHPWKQGAGTAGKPSNTTSATSTPSPGASSPGGVSSLQQFTNDLFGLSIPYDASVFKLGTAPVLLKLGPTPAFQVAFAAPGETRVGAAPADSFGVNIYRQDTPVGASDAGQIKTQLQALADQMATQTGAAAGSGTLSMDRIGSALRYTTDFAWKQAGKDLRSTVAWLYAGPYVYEVVCQAAAGDWDAMEPYFRQALSYFEDLARTAASALPSVSAPPSVAADHLSVTVLGTVSATPGVLARVPFVIESAKYHRCILRVLITDQNGNVLKRYHSGKGWWYPTNKSSTFSFTCTNEPGAYRYSVVARDVKGGPWSTPDSAAFVVH